MSARADYFDERRAGQVDMTRALRSPGSTLKPFIYGLGFEDGFVHPETLIDDRPMRFGNYAPENFDLTFQGTVPVRKALQLSLNVPAVALLDRVGASRLTARLTQAGGALVLPKDEAPGLAMGLGGVGVTLADLAQLYAGLARLGTTIAADRTRAATTRRAPPRRLLDPVAAWYVGNVLIGTPPPDNAAARPHRLQDRHLLRLSRRLGGRLRRPACTIGVWVGRPDGAPVPGLVGRTAAAPILFDAFARTGELPAPLPQAPKGAISSPPTPSCRCRCSASVPDGLAGAAAPSRRCASCSRRTARGSNLPRATAQPDPVALKIAGGVEPLTVLVNGVPQDARATGGPCSSIPTGRASCA